MQHCRSGLRLAQRIPSMSLELPERNQGLSGYIAACQQPWRLILSSLKRKALNCLSDPEPRTLTKAPTPIR